MAKGNIDIATGEKIFSGDAVERFLKKVSLLPECFGIMLNLMLFLMNLELSYLMILYLIIILHLRLKMSELNGVEMKRKLLEE